jgi:hypothetical protein
VLHIELRASFSVAKFEIVKELHFIAFINYKETGNHRLYTIKALYLRMPSIHHSQVWNSFKTIP